MANASGSHSAQILQRALQGVSCLHLMKSAMSICYRLQQTLLGVMQLVLGNHMLAELHDIPRHCVQPAGASLSSVQEP